MQEYQREILDEKSSFLVDNLNVDERFSAHAIETKLLPKEGIDEVLSRPTSVKRAYRFVQLLKKRSSACFDEFLNVLKETDQEHIFHELNFLRNQKVKNVPKSPNTGETLEGTDWSQMFGRELSAQEIRTLKQKFVSKKDYEYVNEEKHMLRKEQKKFEKQVAEQKERVEYEERHRQIVCDELKIENARTKKLEEKCQELQGEVEQVRRYSVDLENTNKDLVVRLQHSTHKIAELEHILQEYQMSEMTQLEEDNNSVFRQESEEPGDDNGNELTVSGELEVLERTRVEVTDHERELLGLRQHLQELKNEIHRVDQELTNTRKEVRKRINICNEEVIVNDHKENANKQVAKPASKPHKHHKRGVKLIARDVQHNRLLNLETDVSVLKSKLKRSEEVIHQQEIFMQQKDKELHHAKHRADQLWQRLQAQQTHTDTQSGQEAVMAHTPNYVNSLLHTQEHSLQKGRTWADISPLSLNLRHDKDLSPVNLRGTRYQSKRSENVSLSSELSQYRGKSPIITHRSQLPPVISLDMETSGLTTRRPNTLDSGR